MTPLAVVAGHLRWSILFALLLGWGEVRLAGSGNLGAANVLRVRRTMVALMVRLRDIGKVVRRTVRRRRGRGGTAAV